jgi:hypothetical protein
MDEGPCDGHNGGAATIRSDKGRGDRLRDLVLAELLSTYTRSLWYGLSMVDREQHSGSVKTWSRAGIRRRQVGDVESKSLDDNTCGDSRQATLPRVWKNEL